MLVATMTIADTPDAYGKECFQHKVPFLGGTQDVPGMKLVGSGDLLAGKVKVNTKQCQYYNDLTRSQTKHPRKAQHRCHKAVENLARTWRGRFASAHLEPTGP